MSLYNITAAVCHKVSCRISSNMERLKHMQIMSIDFELQNHLEDEGGVTEMFLRNSDSVPQRCMEEEEGDVQSNSAPKRMEQCEPINSSVV